MWSTARGPNPWLFPYKNNSEIDNPWQFCKKKPLGFSKINSQSMISQLGPLFLKNNPKKVPSLRKSTKIALKLQNSISFQPQLQIQ
jgi:hypothetical protein